MSAIGNVYASLRSNQKAERLSEALAFWPAEGCLAAQGRYAEAERLLVDSYPTIERRRGKRYRSTLEALQRVVRLYEAWGRLDEADRHRQALERNRAGG